MNIKVAAFTVSEKSNYTRMVISFIASSQQQRSVYQRPTVAQLSLALTICESRATFLIFLVSSYM